MPGGITQYVLRGGPCDGKQGTLTPAIEQSGQLTCNNHIYKITYPVQIDGGREVFKDAGAVPAPKEGVSTPHTHHGWSDLQHSFNRNMPKSLNGARKYQEAALRSLGRGRKVRG